MDIIEGVSIISVGEAKGHDLYVDDTTLQEVKSCAESYAGGVKVNLDHGAGIQDIVGFVNNFRIINDKLVGDLNLLENAEKRSYVLEIAERLPDAFGISISFSGPVREIDGKRFASCTELYSADLVQTPAANPTGLFSFQAVDTSSSLMDDQNTNSALEDGEKDDPMKDVMSRLESLEAFVADYKKKMEEMPEAEKEDDSEMSEDSALSRLEAKLDNIVKTFGAQPMKASAPEAPAKEEQPIDLKAIINDKTSELGSRTEAIKFAMTNHPAEYIALRDSNQLNF